MGRINLVSLYELTNNSDKSTLLQTLQEWNLIPAEGKYMCPNCDVALRLGNDSERFIRK